MAELSKQEIFLSDLASLEAQISAIKTKVSGTAERNIELFNEVNSLKKENAELRQKISILEKGINALSVEGDNGLFGSLDSKERDALKQKLQSLIQRIDYHLSS